MILGSDLHVVIGFDEPRYYISLALTVIVFLVLIKRVPRFSEKLQNTLIKLLGTIFNAILALNHVIFVLSEHYVWDVHFALPLHLCSVSFLLLGINSFIRKRWIWEITLFLGIIGGFHSLLTPELSGGDHPYFYFVYYFKHGAILFMPFLHAKIWGFGLGKKSWLRLLLYINVYMVLTIVLNWALNRFIPGTQVANYFYTWGPPSANNPIIQGEWPWYLIPCEIALIVHLLLIQLGYTWFTQRRKAA